MSRTVKYDELYPIEGPNYSYEDEIEGVHFVTSLFVSGDGEAFGQFSWSGYGWYAMGYFTYVIPLTRGFSIGPMQCDDTVPSDRQATWKLICA